MNEQQDRKNRGAFFTPREVGEHLARWAVRHPEDRVLEPSYSDADLLLPAARQLRALRGDRPLSAKALCGVDIHERSTIRAREALAEEGFAADIRCGSFFDLADSEKFEVVIGSPPFIRYQDFTGEARSQAMRAALAHGVRLSGLASSWAAFVIQAAMHLTPAGRLALVLPAELLSVNYAKEIRRFLLKRFGSVRIIAFEERVFPEVLEEVVLLLAEGEGGADVSPVPPPAIRRVRS